MFLQPSEAGKAFHLVRESTRNNISTVFWATGSLERRAEVFEIPVDSLTQRITFAFSFGAEGDNVTIVAPSRGAITQNSSDTEITEFTDIRHFVSKVEPTEFTLGPDQLETVRAALTVPPGTSQAIGDDVVVVATSTAGPATSNSSVAHFSVTVPASNPSR